MTTTRRSDRKKTNKKKKHWFWRILVILLILLISYSVYLYFHAKQTVDQAYVSDEREYSDLRLAPLSKDANTLSVLFIGVDQGGGRSTEGYGLSDALILATLNKNEGTVKTLSIPRDSYVYIPQRDQTTKITHAHAYGGPMYTIASLERLLDVPIDFHVTLNFDAFIGVIDALNGIDVEVPFELTEMDSNDEHGAIHLLPGEQTLNGEEALALARTRKLDNDIERGKRQQLILRAILDRAKSPRTLITAPALIDSIGEHMTTSMPFSRMTSLLSPSFLTGLEIESLHLEGQDLWTDAYYYQLNDESVNQVSQTLRNHLELDN